MIDPQAVVVGLLTPPGRGALAVVGVTGRDAAAVVDRMFESRGGRTVAAREDGAITFGTWRSTGEDLVVVRRREDLVEVHCHGGVAAAAAVIGSLVAGGAEEVPWAAWLGASGAAQTIVEAHEALGRVGGPKAARILARQSAGALDAELARIEALQATGDAIAAESICHRLVRAARVGLRLTRPWRVVVTGPVNAGKSSLVNALAGHGRCIVSAEPGTTRDLVETRLVLDGWDVVLVDTAGLRDEHAASPVERAGMARAMTAVAAADVVVRVCPAGARPAEPDGRGDLLVVTKSDLAPPGTERPAGVVATSAVTGAGIDRLVTEIVARLVPEETREPDLLLGAVPFTQRQLDMIVRLTRRRASPPSSGHE